MASEPSPPDWRVEIEAAVAADRLTLDEAKTVFGLWEREDGTLVAPNLRYRALVREILAAVEIDVEAEITVDKPAAPARKAVPRAPERPRKRRAARKRTQRDASTATITRHARQGGAGDPFQALEDPGRTPDRLGVGEPGRDDGLAPS